MGRIVFTIITFLLGSLIITSCQGDYRVIGYGIVLKDSIPAFETPSFKDAKPVKYLTYGTPLEIVMEGDKEMPPYLYIVRSEGKILYVRQDDVYTNVKIIEGGTPGNPSKKERYFVLNKGIVNWKDGANVYTELVQKVETNIMKVSDTLSETRLITNFSPKGYNSVVWGTTFYVLFEKNRDITPPQFYTEPITSRINYEKNTKKKYYFLVMDILNPSFVGYIDNLALDTSVSVGVVVKEDTKVLASPTKSGKETGQTLNVFDIVLVEKDEYGGFYKIKSSPFLPDIKSGFIPSESLSMEINDVMFCYKLLSYTNDLNDLEAFNANESRKNEFLSFLKEFLSKNSDSKLYKYVVGIFNNLSTSEQFKEEDSDSDEY